MNIRLERTAVQAEVAELEELLASVPEDDVVGRIGLEARRDELQALLEQLGQREQRTASVALYFGGKPVVGTVGIQAEFAGEMIATYQDLITKVWASADTDLAARGPVPFKRGADLHVTGIVHGSVGFLLEEIDEAGEPLFETPLRQAAAAATDLLLHFADENDRSFEQAIETVSPRVFSSLRSFFEFVHRDEAVLRVVEGEHDRLFDRTAIERAYRRIEASNVDEEMYAAEGELLGVIPIGRRFEFQTAEGIISGKVGLKFSQSYVERVSQEQFAGRRWRALFHRREVQKLGRKTISYVLENLEDLSAQK